MTEFFNAAVSVGIVLVSSIGGMMIHELRQIRIKLDSINDSHIRHDERITSHSKHLEEHEHRLHKLENRLP